MKPDPTYSRLFFSGSDLNRNQFGLSTLHSFGQIIEAIEAGLNEINYYTTRGTFSSFTEALDALNDKECVVITDQPSNEKLQQLNDNQSSDFPAVVKSALEDGDLLIFKEPSEHGFNITMLSVKNRYIDFFYHLQKLLPDSFRFFSINAKRVRSERDLHFDTWTLHRPPHGFEEVFPESVL